MDTPQDIKDMSSEQLALIVNQQYLTIRQCEQNLLVINAELQERIKNKGQ